MSYIYNSHFPILNATMKYNYFFFHTTIVVIQDINLSFITLWLLRCLYDYFDPCGNFSDTSHFKFQKLKGSIGHGFPVCIRTENQNQVSFYPFVLHEISVLIELTLGHLCYSLTDVPPQPNSPPDVVSRVTSRTSRLKSRTRRPWRRLGVTSRDK